ncbi:hypothetical protein MNBD_GAMMA14-1796 [hydrothermal vent metagenome]|uniref:Two-component transcriptional response regulator, LuxR family n=1 Tax=hydrothermal vent metagenome TaxID=652676 RepID=A0A3B0Z3C2_9ZZZZ
MKLLIVEDENKIGDYLRQGLSEAGFVVDLARNGLDGHHLAMTEDFDLLILDVMLPDIDGWNSVPMTTWSNRLPFPSCWREYAPCCDAAPPRSLIASQVWDMNFDSDTNVIDVAIRRLRAKIDENFEPKLIHTRRGMGYMLDIPDAT